MLAGFQDVYCKNTVRCAVELSWKIPSHLVCSYTTLCYTNILHCRKILVITWRLQ